MLKPLAYIAFVVFLIDVLLAYGMYDKWANPLILTQTAIKPDFLLTNTRLYLDEENHERSLLSLEDGIAVIRQLQRHAHPQSQELIDQALTELEGIYLSLYHKEPEHELLNEACINMLLALTHTQVKAAVYFLDQGEIQKVRKSLRFGMFHVKNALSFSRGLKKSYEISIYTEMDEVVKNHHLTGEQVREKLSYVLARIEKLEVGLHH